MKKRTVKNTLVGDRALRPGYLIFRWARRSM